MITHFATANGRPELTASDDAYWLHVESPTEDEEAALRDRFGVPRAFVAAALDLRGVARTAQRDSVRMILVRVPHFYGDEERVPYRTVPLAMIVTPSHFITVSPSHIDLMRGVVSREATMSVSLSESNPLILAILAEVSERYAECLEDLDRVLEDVEERLKDSVENSELLELLKLEKSLVHLSMGLNWNDDMMQRLPDVDEFAWRPSDFELLEDARIEHNQARHRAEVLLTILGETTETYNSIIANNLNAVMKFMAAVSIILSVLVLVATLYSVNVPVPGDDSPMTFPILIAVGLLFTAITTYLLYKRGMLSMWSSGR